jgi:kynurenine formamidase
MTKARIAVIAAGAYLIGAFSGTVTLGQDKWYPSRWGANDQRGAANRLTPAKALDAKAMITKGTVYQLGRVYEMGMPLFGSRHYSLKIPYVFPMAGKNQAVYHDELISGELGQIGTQFDGLGHVGIGELFYNGNKRGDFAAADGLKKLGVENVGAIVTRGVLIDVAKYKNVASLNAPYAITVADLTGALQRQKVDIRPGDVVLVHTGWGSLWMKDNAKFGASSPGLSVQAGEWLASKDVVVVGSDNWGVEAFPSQDPNVSAPVHQLLLAKNGIYIHENLATEVLARDNVYEFAYVFAPLRLKGATGSPGNPIAIR